MSAWDAACFEERCRHSGSSHLTFTVTHMPHGEKTGTHFGSDHLALTPPGPCVSFCLSCLWIPVFLPSQTTLAHSERRRSQFS